MAQLLLKKGADVNARDPHNHTALCFLLCGATVSNDLHAQFADDTLRLLLDADADVSVSDFGGATPLMWVICMYIRMYVYVLDAYADVSVTDFSGDTPLLWVICMYVRMYVYACIGLGCLC
jgi:hypothetical protein